MRIEPDDEDEPEDTAEYYELDDEARERMWRNIEIALLADCPEFLRALGWEVGVD